MASDPHFPARLQAASTKRKWKYNAIAGTFWTDRGVRSLSDDARNLFLYVLSCPERVTEGLYRFSPALAASRLAWDPERLIVAFDALDKAKMVRLDEDAEVVFVCHGLKYNPPRGTPSIRGALKSLDETTDAPKLFEAFVSAARRYAPPFADAIAERYGLNFEHMVGPLSNAPRDDPS